MVQFFDASQASNQYSLKQPIIAYRDEIWHIGLCYIQVNESFTCLIFIAKDIFWTASGGTESLELKQLEK